ncbi:MAG: fibronectin type III domain-containing protein [Planctomycetia bacterium]|nr:fibronectin type III domain-containing protein [Planctomycetia bacterium]
MPGLERGVEYEIQIRAVNDVGNSPWREATFTAPDVPAAPTGLQAIVAQDELGAIELSWAAPAVGAGELAIVDYVIEQSTDGGSSWSLVSDDVSTAITFRVTELDRGDGEHVFRVAAKNILPGVPNSELTYSASSVAVRPLGRSLAVQSLTPSAGDQQAVISWTAPADTGGLPITNYLVEQDDGAGDWSTVGTGTSTELSRTVTGLTNGQSYRFRVTPQTTLGQSTLNGAVSLTELVMPFGVPSVPTGLVVSGGVGRLTASWTASSPNGRVVSDYVIQWAEAANGPWNTYPDGSGTATSVDLIAGTAASDTGEILPADLGCSNCSDWPYSKCESRWNDWIGVVSTGQ